MKVGIFRFDFPLYSEVFIPEQAKNTNVEHTFLCRNYRGEGEKPVNVLELATSKLSKIMLMLFGWIRPSLKKDIMSLDLIHAHFGQDGVVALKLAQRFNKPLIVTFHGQDCTVRTWHKLRSFQISNYLYLYRRKKLFERASKIIAVSDFIKQTLIKQGCPEGKICVHYIGVDIEKFQKSIIKDVSKGSPRSLKLLSVGRHEEKKGLEYLIRAIDKTKCDVTLDIIGDGSKFDSNLNLVLELGLEGHVQLLGKKTSKEVSRAMGEADIFCLPSVTANNGDCEAFGIVFIEAAARGVPVVSTMHGGIPEAVDNNITGILCQERDSEQLARAFELLGQKPELAKTMGEAGRVMVEKHFDIKLQGEKLLEIYEEAVKHGS